MIVVPFILLELLSFYGSMRFASGLAVVQHGITHA